MGPGVGCDLMTSVVREFDTLDLLWVVNTAPWVALRLTYSRDQLMGCTYSYFHLCQDFERDRDYAAKKGRTEKESAFRSSRCQRVAHVVSESSQ